jgi:hypothetical protein
MSEFINLDVLRRCIEGRVGTKIKLVRTELLGEKMTLFIPDKFSGELYPAAGGPVRGIMFYNSLGGSVCHFVHAVVFDSELLPGKKLSLAHAIRVGFPVTGTPLGYHHVAEVMHYQNMA